MRSFRKFTLAGLVAGTALALMAPVAAAAPSPSGFDDVNDIAYGAGSDTTFMVIQDVAKLYNSSPGCITDNATGSATRAKCLLGAAQTSTDVRGNWDHDIIINEYPTGSSAGVRALVLGQADYARSSRPPRSSGESGTSFWGFAKDGLTVITLGGRTGVSLTKTQIQSIWNCSVTTWGALLGTSDTAPIEPWSMNTSSGTYDVFRTYLGFDPNAGACVKKLANGTAPQENDTKPISAFYTATGGTLSNAIWWGAFAEFSSFPYKLGSGDFAIIDGVYPSGSAIANNSYPITRLVYHVTKTADATPTANSTSSLTLTGTVGGKGGAVREFTEFMCSPSSGHTIDPFLGTNYFSGITAAYTANGYVRVPAAERTNGACRLVVAP